MLVISSIKRYVSRHLNFLLFVFCWLVVDCASAQSTFPDHQSQKIEPLHNPERGYHLEANYFIDNLINPFSKVAYTPDWIDELNEKYHCNADSLSTIQLYIYLTAYVGKDIPESAFMHLQKLFDDVERKGYKLVLRFAYDDTYYATKASYQDVFRHLNQLESFIKQNIGLIDIWQIGFIGAWGEGHSSSMAQDHKQKSEIVRRILDIFEDRQTTMRYPEQKNQLTLDTIYQRRIGYNNDYFTASEHPKAPGNDYVFSMPVYEQVKRESAFVKVIGEIPYAENTEWGLHQIISVENTLRILRDHHYSLFDITQNNELNIANWKRCTLEPSKLSQLGVLFDSTYFFENGKKCNRSAYDFIRDHLGYRLYVNKAETEVWGEHEKLHYLISLKNVGFSAIHNPRPVFLVLVNDEGKVEFQEQLNIDPRMWQPFDPEQQTYKVLKHIIKGSVPVHLKGVLRVGLWLPDATEKLKYNKNYAIQFANRDLEIFTDRANKYKVNMVGKIILQ